MMCYVLLGLLAVFGSALAGGATVEQQSEESQVLNDSEKLEESKRFTKGVMAAGALMIVLSVAIVAAKLFLGRKSSPVAASSSMAFKFY